VVPVSCRKNPGSCQSAFSTQSGAGTRNGSATAAAASHQIPMASGMLKTEISGDAVIRRIE
jgi:hypothetical protein